MTYKKVNCPVCNLENARSFYDGVSEIRCERCGRYRIGDRAAAKLDELPKDGDARPLMAGWIWEQNKMAGTVPDITFDNISILMRLPKLSFFERAKRLLIFLVDNTPRIGVMIPTRHPSSIGAILQTFDPSEITGLVLFLGEQQWVTPGRNGEFATVRGEGFIKVDEWKQASPNSIQGFVAMWFDPSMDKAWSDGIRPGIERSGYKPSRIDAKQHINKICDEIIAEIKRSRFVVADYTGHRGGVYYEAGYAAGRGLPVIPTCRKDEMGTLHFDIRQYNCIDWQAPEELADRLQARIEALFGDGPLKKN